MSEMTPEQQAAYALEHGLTKDDLPVAAQVAYDRMKNAGLVPGRPIVNPPPHGFHRDQHGHVVEDKQKPAVRPQAGPRSASESEAQDPNEAARARRSTDRAGAPGPRHLHTERTWRLPTPARSGTPPCSLPGWWGSSWC